MRALAALAPHLPVAERDAALAEALSAARSIGDEWSRSSALAAVAPPLARRMNSSKKVPVEPSAKNHDVAGEATPAPACPAPNG